MVFAPLWLEMFALVVGLVMGGLAWFVFVRLVLRHVRTFCHSQLISSSVGVRSSAMLSPSGLALSAFAALAPDWLDCCGLDADWSGSGDLCCDWLMCVG